MICEVILTNETTGVRCLRKMAKVGKRDVLFAKTDATHDEFGKPYRFSVRTIDALEKAEFLLEGVKSRLKEMAEIYTSECGVELEIDEKALFVWYDTNNPRFQALGQSAGDTGASGKTAELRILHYGGRL